MKEKTYRRMTKKRSLRGLRLFKQKYLTKQWFFALLAKIHLVREVKKLHSYPYNNSNTLSQVRVLNEKIKTDRGTFNLSYKADCISVHRHWWYESIFKKKRLLTIEDVEEFDVCIVAHSECESFLVKIDPFNSATVHRFTPYVPVFHKVSELALTFDPKEEVKESKVTRKYCDFLNARLATSVRMLVQDEKGIDDAIKELVGKAKTQLHNYIEGNPEVINEHLTGVKYDGEFHTAEGKRLIPNTICHRCGRPVFESSVEGYTAQCIFCDEDLYSIEIDKVDPEKYKVIYDFNKYAMYKLLVECNGSADYQW